MSAIKHYNAAEVAALADIALAASLEVYCAFREKQRIADENKRIDAWFAEEEQRDWNRQEIEYDDLSF